MVWLLGLLAVAPGSRPFLPSASPRFLNSKLVFSGQLGFLIMFLLRLNCFFQIIKSGGPVNSLDS